MKQKSMTAPVTLPTDSDVLKGQIRQLQAKGYKVWRPTIHQIKIAKYNWYWGTGKITIDPDAVHRYNGFDAFLRLLEADASWAATRPLMLRLPEPMTTETL